MNYKNYKKLFESVKRKSKKKFTKTIQFQRDAKKRGEL